MNKEIYELVNEFSGEGINKIVEELRWSDSIIDEIAGELFSDAITLSRIVHFFIFTEKLIKRYPEKRKKIYEAFFKSLSKNLHF